MKKILQIAFLLVAWSPYAQQIERIEYWVDGDPGYGIATPVTLTPAANLQELIFSHLLSLTPGMHTLGIRSKDSNGRWSQTQMAPFMISEVFPQIEIVAIEYFWDGDAGFGQNQVYHDFSPSSNLSEHIFQANVPANFSTNSTHILFSRSVDENGKYSQTNIVEEVALGNADFSNIGINIYPNPIQSELNIQLDSGKSRLIIHDISGKQILDTVVDHTARIDLSHLSAGVYTAYFWKETNKIYLVKLIKQ